MSVTYQGRRTTRKSSTERRTLILEATLRIIVSDGIRGVKHRAVAAEASVPLAATTYYFKDINDLISDAFSFFAEQIGAENANLGAAAFGLIEGKTPEQLADPVVRAALAERLARIFTAHVMQQVADRDSRIIEITFRQEALRNPLLKKAIDSNLQQTLQAIALFFQQMGIDGAKQSANLILAVLHHLEYMYTLEGINGHEADLYDILSRQVTAVLTPYPK